MWISLRPVDIPDAGSIRLKPRSTRTLASLDNPLEALTAALSGSAGGPSWACLNQGVELPLTIGIFDIVGIESIEGYPVPAACILNLDVNLEIESAPETKESLPVKAPLPVFEPPPGVMWFAGMEKIVGCKR